MKRIVNKVEQKFKKVRPVKPDTGKIHEKNKMG